VSTPFQVIGTEQILHAHVFDVERRSVRHGSAVFARDVVTHAGAVAILARNDRDEIGFLRQYRATVDRINLEIPAGTMDVVGEDPLTTAKRELREELGCEAATWRSLGTFTVSPGWTDQLMTLFEATDLTHVRRHPEGPEEISSSVEWIPVSEIKSTLRNEPTMDYTVAVALHCVFGSFFDPD